MDVLSNKQQEYSNGIPYRNVSDAIETYYYTRDQRIRNQLFYRYMPRVKKQILRYDITFIEKEDLEQIACEYLLKCIDQYDPSFNYSFSIYLYNFIDRTVKELVKDHENQSSISLSDVDIYSNSNLEDRFLAEITSNEVLIEFKKYLENHSEEKATDIVKKIYGIDCEPVGIRDIAKEDGTTASNIHQIKNRFLLYFYFCLPKSHQYYPSKALEKIFVNYTSSAGDLSRKSKTIINHLNLKKMASFMFYGDCDSLKDSHSMFVFEESENRYGK